MIEFSQYRHAHDATYKEQLDVSFNAGGSSRKNNIHIKCTNGDSIFWLDVDWKSLINILIKYFIINIKFKINKILRLCRITRKYSYFK